MEGGRKREVAGFGVERRGKKRKKPLGGILVIFQFLFIYLFIYGEDLIKRNMENFYTLLIYTNLHIVF